VRIRAHLCPRGRPVWCRVTSGVVLFSVLAAVTLSMSLVAGAGTDTVYRSTDCTGTVLLLNIHAWELCINLLRQPEGVI